MEAKVALITVDDTDQNTDTKIKRHFFTKCLTTEVLGQPEDIFPLVADIDQAEIDTLKEGGQGRSNVMAKMNEIVRGDGSYNLIFWFSENNKLGFGDDYVKAVFKRVKEETDKFNNDLPTVVVLFSCQRASFAERYNKECIEQKINVRYLGFKHLVHMNNNVSEIYECEDVYKPTSLPTVPCYLRGEPVHNPEYIKEFFDTIGSMKPPIRQNSLPLERVKCCLAYVRRVRQDFVQNLINGSRMCKKLNWNTINDQARHILHATNPTEGDATITTTACSEAEPCRSNLPYTDNNSITNNALASNTEDMPWWIFQKTISSMTDEQIRKQLFDNNMNISFRPTMNPITKPVYVSKIKTVVQQDFNSLIKTTRDKVGLRNKLFSSNPQSPGFFTRDYPSLLIFRDFGAINVDNWPEFVEAFNIYRGNLAVITSTIEQLKLEELTANNIDAIARAKVTADAAAARRAQQAQQAQERKAARGVQGSNRQGGGKRTRKMHKRKINKRKTKHSRRFPRMTRRRS